MFYYVYPILDDLVSTASEGGQFMWPHPATFWAVLAALAVGALKAFPEMIHDPLCSDE